MVVFWVLLPVYPWCDCCLFMNLAYCLHMYFTFQSCNAQKVILALLTVSYLFLEWLQVSSKMVYIVCPLQYLHYIMSINMDSGVLWLPHVSLPSLIVHYACIMHCSSTLKPQWSQLKLSVHQHGPWSTLATSCQPTITYHALCIVLPHWSHMHREYFVYLMIHRKNWHDCAVCTK